MIISYSTRDRDGKKYSKLLADDLGTYGVKVYADLDRYRPPELIGRPWFDGFIELVPDQDYYILVVTESFEQSHAMNEFKKFRHCPETCTEVCGRSKSSCKLKKIIPCFFVDPSTVDPQIKRIGGVREFWDNENKVITYESGFMELIRQMFPEPSYADLTSKDIGEIIKFCKETEELLTLISDQYNYATDAIRENFTDQAYNFAKTIKELKERRLVYKYRCCPEIIKSWMDIKILKELDRLVKVIEKEGDVDELKNINELKNIEDAIQDMIIELNKKMKDLSVQLARLTV